MPIIATRVGGIPEIFGPAAGATGSAGRRRGARPRDRRTVLADPARHRRRSGRPARLAATRASTSPPCSRQVEALYRRMHRAQMHADSEDTAGFRAARRQGCVNLFDEIAGYHRPRAGNTRRCERAIGFENDELCRVKTGRRASRRTAARTQCTSPARSPARPVADAISPVVLTGLVRARRISDCRNRTAAYWGAGLSQGRVRAGLCGCAMLLVPLAAMIAFQAFEIYSVGGVPQPHPPAHAARAGMDAGVPGGVRDLVLRQVRRHVFAGYGRRAGSPPASPRCWSAASR